MRGRFVVAVVMVVAGVCCIAPGAAIAHADGPVIDRCLEFLEPYTPVEWNRCIGNEFNKFPKAPPELKEQYLKAPSTGEWPSAQTFVPGDNAPKVTLPYVDETGLVYVAPRGYNSYATPYSAGGEPSYGAMWWQESPDVAAQSAPVDVYSTWQNYWMSHGATGYGGWAVPGGYAAAPW